MSDVRIGRFTVDFKNYHKDRLMSLVKLDCRDKETFDKLYTAIYDILEDELENLNKESSE